jgi:DNA-binding PadR family transcriptional regulator
LRLHGHFRRLGGRMERPEGARCGQGEDGGRGERCARGLGMHRGRHGHHHGGGGRGGRLFDYGELRFVLLDMIAETPRHGYELIKAIEERMGGAYSPSPGVIYPTLTLLEEQGLATASAEGGKRLYAATDAGRELLAANAAALADLAARMQRLGAGREDGPAPQILRAIENLKTALRLRFARGAIPPERVQAIAAAIDAAAAEAERE